MFSCENRAGRLIEVRYDGPGTLQDHQMLNTGVFALRARMASPAVFCTDMRSVSELPESLAKRLADTYRKVNARIERTAIVVRFDAKAAEQLDRIVREAGHPSRCVFRHPTDAKEWLGEVLDVAERARAAAFLDGG